jgi:hypothetical protein
VGIDQTGKTELCELLEKESDGAAEVRRIVDHPNDPDTLTKAGREVKGWSGMPVGLIVYDRFPYPDEFVYGKKLKLSDLVHWERRIAESGARVKVVYCEPQNISLYQHRVRENPDEHFDMSNMEVFLDHVSHYKRWLVQTRLPVFRLNSDNIYDEEVARRVLAWIWR